MERPTLLFDDHPSPMIIFDTDSLDIIEVNKRAVTHYGYQKDQFLQLTLEDIHASGDISILHTYLKEAKADAEIEDMGLLRHQTRDGETRYVRAYYQPIMVSGRNARIMHINDITDTVHLKQEVEQAYHDQQHHINHNPLGMLKYDENLRIIEWSTRAEEKTGYMKQEVLGKSSSDLTLFEESEMPFIQERLRQLSDGEKDADRFETLLKLKNGEIMEVRLHASALRGLKGKMKSILAFIENISTQRERGRQLEQREHKYHRLFEDANDGIFLMRDLTFIDCNRQITEIFQASKQEIIGKSPLDFSPEIQPDGQRSAQKARRSMRGLAFQNYSATFSNKYSCIVSLVSPLLKPPWIPYIRRINSISSFKTNLLDSLKASIYSFGCVGVCFIIS